MPAPVGCRVCHSAGQPQALFFFKTKVKDIIIIGGGLAGLTSAIQLARAGLSVLLLEKHSYPLHKVCGEYVSNEVRPFLEEK